MEQSRSPHRRGLPDDLRAAIEEGGAAVARRAEDARAELARRGTQAREASTTAATGLIEAVSEALRRDSHSKPEGK